MKGHQLIYLWFFISISVTVDASCHCESNTQRFPDSTGFLFLDYEVDIVAMVPNSTAKTYFLNQSCRWLEAVRTSGRNSTQIISARVGFRPGYPDVSCRNKFLSPVKNADILIDGTPGTNFYPGFEPKSNEIQFHRSRVSAAYNSELLTLLDSQCIKTVVLTGLFTSIVILSTTRQLADMDFTIYIVQDAVIDPDPTVNEFLFDKILPVQANILTFDAAKKML
jgi:nicotinamidase-related amidase